MLDPVELFLNRLQHPVMAGIDLKLDRVVRLMSLIGSPHKRLPPVIHVAGTNGKGSLIANLQAIFQAAGYRVHRYTSPHLVRFSERILLQGKEIEQAYLQSLLKHLATILQQQPATFFEATTALAFLAFAEKPADVFLLEVGLGGRLDATNVVEKPVLTAITPVSFDHMNFLGNSIADIAGEKAGILKKDVPCVVGRQVMEAENVIEKKAAGLPAPLYRLNHEWFQENGQYRSAIRTIGLKPALLGEHQLDNAATAVACIDRLPQFSISDAHIAQGLASAVWPARLQQLTSGRFINLLPPGSELWLDGGHNQQGGEVLAAWLKSRNAKGIYMVCGLMGKKDEKSYLRPLVPYVHTLYAVPIPDEAQSLTPAQLAASAREVGIAAEAANSMENALQTIAGHAKTPATVYICGSLYLAGKVLAAHQVVGSCMQDIIERAWEERQTLGTDTKGEVRKAVEDVLARLDAGELRVAEKSGKEWVVNQWIKKAVVLSFRLNPMEVSSGPAFAAGQSHWWDKVPSKFSGWDEARFRQAGFRAVPGCVVRRSAYIAKDVVLMPSFVNVGAYVGEGTMVDTWTTVGSCAQIGKHCHLSGGVGIGGVLEPLQAAPVIIEDNCFIGARSEVAEGVIVEEGAVISMGVYLGASTKIVDRDTGTVTYGRVPAYSVVVPGTLPGKTAASPGLYCAVIVKRVDEKTRAKTSINELLRN